LLTRVADQIAIAIENALAYRQISKLKEKLAEGIEPKQFS
jgi:GAF domain-containing protein